MISPFVVQRGCLAQEQVEERSELLQHGLIWIGMIDPDDEELAWIKETYGMVLPELEQLRDPKVSTRYFEGEGGRIRIRVGFLLDEGTTSCNVHMAFVLTEDVLSSIHDKDLPAFRLVCMRTRLRPDSARNTKDVLMDLYAADAEYSTDSIEGVYEHLEDASRRVPADEVTDTATADVLEITARMEDLNGRIRRNMMDTHHAVPFLPRSQLLSASQQDEARQVLRDINSIENHTAFLSGKVSSLMDAIVGFINISQNKITRLFSMVSVALMPPTLIASVCGMNFKVMPKLDWAEGCSCAIMMVVVSAAIPLVYFRREGWLR